MPLGSLTVKVKATDSGEFITCFIFIFIIRGEITCSLTGNLQKHYFDQLPLTIRETALASPFPRLVHALLASIDVQPRH